MIDDDLDAALHARLEDIAEHLFGPPNRETLSRQEWRWGSKGGRALVVRGLKRGSFSDHESGAAGGPLAMIGAGRNCSIPDAAKWARSYLGIEGAAPPDPAERDQRQRERDQWARLAAAAAAEDEARRSAGARRRCERAGPIEVGSPADIYLTATRAIPRPNTGWPADAVRYDPRNRAILLPLTAPDGDVQAVQAIHITAAGRKVDAAEVFARNLRNAKVTYGPMGTAVARLPGPVIGPLLIAEGPETALTVWRATGFETWATIGPMPRAELPIGRRVVLCVDDDAEHAPSSVKLAAAVARWRAAGIDVAVATPWAVRCGDTSDFNNLVVESGIAAVRTRIAEALAGAPETAQPAPAAAPYYPRPDLTGADASKRLKYEVNAFLDCMERRFTAQDWIEAETARRMPALMPVAEARIVAKLVRAGMNLAEAEDAAADRAVKVATTIAKRQARRDAAREFGPEAVANTAPKLQITGAAGLGKTQAIVAAFVGRPPLWRRNIHVYVPLISLSDQFAEAVRVAAERAIPTNDGSSPRVQIIRGRTHAGPDGTLCHPDRLPVVERAQRVCGSTYRACCKTPAGDSGEPESRCPHYDSCAYIAQFTDDRPALRLFAHNHLTLPQPKDLRTPAPDIAVIDESTIGTLTVHAEIDPAWLTDPASYAGPADEQRAAALDIGAAVAWALSGTSPAIEALRLAEISPADLRDAAKCADASHAEPRLVAAMATRTALRRLDEHTPSHGRPVAGILRQLARDMEHGRPTSQCIEYDAAHTLKTDAGTRVAHPLIRRHATKDTLVPQAAAVLLLDADADLSINQRLFGADLQGIVIPAARQAKVTQINDAALATSSLAPGEELANNGTKAKKLRGRITAFVDKLVAEEKRVLVVACLPVRRALTGEKAERIPAWTEWHGAEITHHGAILGSNRWSDFDAVVLIGREQLPPLAAERQARAIWGDDPAAALDLTGAYRGEERAHDMRTGSAPTVQVQVHADPRVQALVELKRERAMGQAIDRLRLIHRPADAPGEIYVLSNLPVPGLVVDRLMRLDDLLDGGTPIERALARMPEGTLPLSPDWLTTHHRDLFGCRRTAASAVADLRVQLGNIDPYCQVALFRAAGQRCPSKALVRVGAASPKGALHRLLGAEIVDFRFLDASPPVAAQASAAVLSEIVLPVPSAPVPVLPVEVPAVPVVLEVTADPPTVPMVSQIEVSPVLPVAEPVPPASVPLPDPAPLVPALAAEAPIAPAPAQLKAPARIVFFRHPAAPANAAWIIPATAAAKRAMEGRCDAA